MSTITVPEVKILLGKDDVPSADDLRALLPYDEQEQELGVYHGTILTPGIRRRLMLTVSQPDLSPML